MLITNLQASFRDHEHLITLLLIGAFPVLALAVPGLQIELGPVPIYIVDALGVGMIGWALFVQNLTPQFPDRRFVGLFALFLLAAIPGLIQGLLLSDFSILYAYTSVRLVLNVAAPVALLSLIRTREQLAATVWGLILGLAIVSLIGIFQIVPVTDSYVISALRWYYPADSFVQHRLSHHSYAFATWYTATPYAGMLAMTAMFPLVLWFKHRSHRLLGIFLVGLLAFVLSETRHAVLAFAPVVLFVFWKSVSRREMAILGGVSALLLGAMEALGIRPSPSTLAQDFVVLFTQFDATDDIAIRIRSYQKFFEFFVEHPLRTAIGYGPDVSSIVGRGVGSPLLSQATEAIPIISVLALIIQFGLVGALVYFVILLYAIWAGLRHLSNVDLESLGDLSYRDAVVFAATAALVVGLFLHPFDQYFARGGTQARYVLWIIMAVQQSAMSFQESGYRNSAFR